MIGGFIEQQNIGRLEQQTAQRNPSPFAAGEKVAGRVTGRAAQRIHRQVELTIEIPAVNMVNLLLQRALFGDQGVVISSGVGELFGDGIVALHQGHDSGHALLNQFADGLLRIEVRFLF